MKASPSIFIIVNPVAAGGKAQADWRQIIVKLFEEIGIECEEIFTERPGHAFQLTIEAVKRGFKTIIAIGGDGTANEVVNGLLHQEEEDPLEIALGVIPVGRGNDWGRSLGLPENYRKIVERIKEGRTVYQDVGVVIYNDSGEKRYFMNAAGIGFSAEVAHRANRARHRPRGTFTYLLNLLITLVKYRSKDAEIYIDGEQAFKGLFFTALVGVGKYSGGGMKLLPEAVLDDGLLDVCIVKDVSMFKVLRNIPRIYDGSFVNDPDVILARGREIRISSAELLHLEVDGESLAPGNFTFSILPGKLRVIV